MSISQSVWSTWENGGWLMWPLAAMAVAIFSKSADLLLHLRRLASPDEGLEAWLRNATPWQDASAEERQAHYDHLRAQLVNTVERRMSFIAALVGAAPLLGLLGTVVGMIVTFEALGGQRGQMMESMADGIAQALITTQTGLSVALPGLFLLLIIRRKRDALLCALAQHEYTTSRALLTEPEGSGGVS